LFDFYAKYSKLILSLKVLLIGFVVIFKSKYILGQKWYTLDDLKQYSAE